MFILYTVLYKIHKDVALYRKLYWKKKIAYQYKDIYTVFIIAWHN